MDEALSPLGGEFEGLAVRKALARFVRAQRAGGFLAGSVPGPRVALATGGLHHLQRVGPEDLAGRPEVPRPDLPFRGRDRG